MSASGTLRVGTINARALSGDLNEDVSCERREVLGTVGLTRDPTPDETQDRLSCFSGDELYVPSHPVPTCFPIFLPRPGVWGNRTHLVQP